MAFNTVTPSDVEVSLGRPLDAAESAQVYQWAESAELLIKRALGDPASLDHEMLDYVVRESIVDRIRTGAGDGLDSITAAVDDGSVTRRFRQSATRDGWLIDGWRRLLAPAGAGGAFSTRPGFQSDAGPSC